MPDAVAVINVVPVVSVEANPDALIVATPVFDECQVADVEISVVEWSDKVPMAINCRVLPRATLGADGVTVIDVMTAGVTDNVVEEVTASYVAAIVVMPLLTAVARPFDPAASLIAATDVIDDVHVAHAVRL